MLLLLQRQRRQLAAFAGLFSLCLRHFYAICPTLQRAGRVQLKDFAVANNITHTQTKSTLWYVCMCAWHIWLLSGSICALFIFLCVAFVFLCLPPAQPPSFFIFPFYFTFTFAPRLPASSPSRRNKSELILLFSQQRRERNSAPGLLIL